MRRANPVKKLFILSTASVMLLLLLSDSSPHDIDSFTEITPSGDLVRMKCLLVSITNSSSGWICVFQDMEGIQIRGFCSETPPPAGSLIEIVANPSSEKDFIYVEKINVLRSSSGENINIY